MKTILFLLTLGGLGYLAIKDTPLAEQIDIHLIAIKRHAIQVAAERAQAVAQSAANPSSLYLYTTTDVFQNSPEGVRSIPKGTLVHIVSMAGDQVTITNGTTIVTTTPDCISHVNPNNSSSSRPHHQNGLLPFPVLLPGEKHPSPPSVESRKPPHSPDATIQARIAQITAQMEALQAEIDACVSSSNRARIRRAQMEIERLDIQRGNLMRQLR